MLRLCLSIILAVMVYGGSVPAGYADYPVQDQARLKVVEQELDKIEPRDNAYAVPVQAKPPAAFSVVPKRNEFQFSNESYWAKYKEPKNNSSQKGFLNGYDIQYAHRFSTNPKSILNMFSVQAQWAAGKFKQPSGVGPSGIKDKTYELRAVVGKDFYPAPKLRATVYGGYGYRYLEDNSYGLDTVFGSSTVLGRERVSHYNYLPIGLEMAYRFNYRFALQGSVEYDYMLDGWQVDKLGVYPTFSTYVVNQKSGNGFRYALRLNFYYNRYFTLFAESFYRLWVIPQSTSKVENGLTLYQPKNVTEEFGLRFGLQI